MKLKYVYNEEVKELENVLAPKEVALLMSFDEEGIDLTNLAIYVEPEGPITQLRLIELMDMSNYVCVVLLEHINGKTTFMVPKYMLDQVRYF